MAHNIISNNAQSDNYDRITQARKLSKKTKPLQSRYKQIKINDKTVIFINLNLSEKKASELIKEYKEKFKQR